MAREGIETIDGQGGQVRHVSRDNSDTPQIEDIIGLRNVGDNGADEIFLVALVLKLGGYHVRGLPCFGKERNRLQKELYGFGHGFLFRMARLVGGAVRVMHSQILGKVDRIEN